MAGIGEDLRGLPAGADLIKGPRVQRQVSTAQGHMHTCNAST